MMKKYFISIIILSLTSLFFLGVLGTKTLTFATDIDESEIEERQERQQELQEERSQYQQQLARKQSSRQTIVRDLLDTNRDLSWSQQRLSTKEQELARKRAQRDVFTNQISQAESDLEKTQDLFEQRMRIYYKNGMHNPLNMFLDAKDLSDLVRRVRYTEGLLAYDSRIIETITSQKDLLIEMKAKLDFEVKEEEALWREIADERSKHQQLYNRHRQLRDEVTRDIRALERLLAEIEREEIQIEFFLEAAAKGNLVTNFDGTFALPLKNYRVSSGFGWRMHPIYRRRRHHNGIDLAASHGEPILASGAGKVIFAGWKTGYGNTVMIDHGRDFATLYAHMSSILVDTNQDVMKGQPIGKVGSTGVSTGDHLHFEIRIKGKPQNPANYINF